MIDSNVAKKVKLVFSDFSFRLFIQIIFEFISYPILILFWTLWNRYSHYIKYPKIYHAVRIVEEEPKAIICFHDWLGYPGKRIKNLKTGTSFYCGRTKILHDILSIKNEISYELYVSLSGHGSLEFDPRNVKAILNVENKGQDFRGYSTALNEVKNIFRNPYIVLMNSSIAGGFYNGWIDDYCSILRNDRSIGLLGISTRARYPGLIQNRYSPHLQSFFLISTLEVLQQILKQNKGLLPGADEKNKYRLIQKGEIALSQQILKLGYKIAAVIKGEIYCYSLKSHLGINLNDWPFPLEDIRHVSTCVEFINSLTKLKGNGPNQET